MVFCFDPGEDVQDLEVLGVLEDKWELEADRGLEDNSGVEDSREEE